MGPKLEKILVKISTGFLLLFGIAVLWFSIRIFVCDYYPINSSSMYPAIIPGDRVMVNKLLFGARIYKNLDFIQGDSLETWRVKGFRNIKHNEIVAFNFPFGNDDWGKIEFKINYVYVKRVIGLPGDSVSISKGFYKNNNYAGLIGNRESQELFSSTPDSLIDENIVRTIPYNKHLNWTIKDFGPAYIPKTGSIVVIDSLNYNLYRTLVEYETGKKMSLAYDGKVYLDNLPLTAYTFKGNYYFMGGDNVGDSKDSRYFGLVPEEFITGIITRVIWSENGSTGKLRKGRILKKLE